MINSTINEPKKEYNREMHTAEHILNQTMIRMFGTGRSVTNHIEKKKSKCDYRFDRALSEEEIRLLEGKVNEIIGQSLDVKESFVSREEAGLKYNVSKLPEDAGDVIRVISVGNYDHCPCIGQHVSNTSEIGGIAIISSDFNNETNILRIRYRIA
jgi:Ser-tRNA(Ala) deacylase AlaX